VGRQLLYTNVCGKGSWKISTEEEEEEDDDDDDEEEEREGNFKIHLSEMIREVMNWFEHSSDVVRLP
jgi:hypothetical protein